MKKLLWTLSVLVLFFVAGTVPAGAVVNNMVKVGLRYGGDAMSSANLENTGTGGYSVGYYDANRTFIALGRLGQTNVTMVPADSLGTFSQSGPYATFDEAAAAAGGGWPAYINGDFYARQSGGGSAHSGTGVAVTATGSSTVLFEFDCQGMSSLGVVPDAGGGNDGGASAWFKGNRYAGGFEYPRVTGGSLYVINVADLEDYVKGVTPYEMPADWPAAALEAQAVCARTFAMRTTKHMSAYGFDVCAATDCQTYCGLGSRTSYATNATNAAVDATAGQCVYYNGKLAETVYHSSDGGATESAETVWGGKTGYLIGKEDPYEASISIPNYNYSVTYTAAELTWILQNSGRKIGMVKNVYVSERTPTGNVCKVVFTDTTGGTLTVTGDDCRMAFYSTTYGKSVKSLRFSINGGGGASYYVNNSGTVLPAVSGAYTISGDGTVSAYSGQSPCVITSSGAEALSGGAPAASSDSFTITGTGNGHNVGMSQYGAKAMAQQGYSYRDILSFYYTDVTIG